MLRQFAAGLAALLVLFAMPAAARVERAAVHSPAIAGNLEGNSADRTVHVVLPPSYDRDKRRRFPVIVFLHGFSATSDKLMEYIPFDAALVAAGKGPQEAIIVVPDGDSRHNGSMYSSSPVTGDFEAFVAQDLFAWVDARYRTLARRESRGLAGHSMGGYGTLRIGMKHPQVFGALYAMNPCCLTPRPVETAEPRFEGLNLDAALAGDFITRANFAVASAWSPNPQRPPFFADLGTKDGKPDMDVFARWWANAPTAMAPQHLPALTAMRAIAMDAGDKDFVLHEGRGMHEVLDRLGVAHGWEVYDGDHGNRVPERFGTKVLPFFAAHLDAAQGRRR